MTNLMLYERTRQNRKMKKFDLFWPWIWPSRSNAILVTRWFWKPGP